MCLYHHYGIVWLSLLQVYSSLQVQPGPIYAANGLFQLGNEIQDGNGTYSPIGWSAAVTTGLYTVHLNLMAISFHLLTIHHIVAVGVGA